MGSKVKRKYFIKVTNENLDSLHELLKNYNVKKFNIIDFRIKNQIILNE